MKHEARAVAAALLVAAMTAAAPAAGQGTANTVRSQAARADVQQALEAEREAAGAVGIVAAVRDRRGADVWTAGTRSLKGAAVDGRTVFEIGSISKVLTGLLLAEMVARGEVALEDPVSRYLPADVRLRSRGREITLLDLATHTSGLPRLPLNLVPADRSNPYAEYDAAKLHAFLSSFEPAREPGAAYEYSNLGAGLLGHVLALRAGMDYEELVAERILQPLGMNDTRLTLDDELGARLARGHDARRRPVPKWQMNVLAGAGGWLSTADDLMRLLAAALAPPDGTLGDAFRMAMTPRREAGQPGVRVGLGWHVLERDGRSIIWHNGQTGGYRAFIGLDPHRGTGAVVLANSAVHIDDFAMQLIQRR